jgi:hypothetical protein
MGVPSHFEEPERRDPCDGVAGKCGSKTSPQQCDRQRSGMAGSNKTYVLGAFASSSG